MEITDEQVALFFPPPKARVRRKAREIAHRPKTPSDVLWDAILQFLGNLPDLLLDAAGAEKTRRFRTSRSVAPIRKEQP